MSGGGVGCLVAIVVVVIVAIVSAVGAISNGAGSSNKDDLAVATCQGLVEDELKAPATASYPEVPTLSGDTISGSVDSQNSFGANIRSNFHCTVVGDSVRLDFVE